MSAVRHAQKVFWVHGYPSAPAHVLRACQCELLMVESGEKFVFMLKILSSQSIKLYIIHAVFIIGVLFFLGAGCQAQKSSSAEPEPPPPTPIKQNNAQETILKKLKAQSEIKKFANIEELRAFLEDRVKESGYGYGRGMLGDISVMKSDFAESEQLAPSQTTADYSRTNIQVEGVDEGDIAKTDGEYIYTISGNTVAIMKAYPAEEAEIISKITFGSSPQGLYIIGKRLAVYGYDNRVYAAEQKVGPGIAVMPGPIIRPGSSFTFVRIFDISDPRNPKEARDLSFEGNYTSSRMIGDYLYFVTASYNNMYRISDDESPLPQILEKGRPVASSNGQIPDVYYFNFPYQSYNFTTVSAINVAQDSVPETREVYLLDSTQTLYVSPQNLYFTYTKYLNEYEVGMEIARDLVQSRLGEKDRDRIKKIDESDSDVLSREEKSQKINAVIERYMARLPETEQSALNDEIERTVKQTYQNIARELEKTVIHKIGLNGSELKYQTFGEVPGSVLNQFSMDESGGYFRIATTKNRSWSIFLDDIASERDSYSNLYVLDSDLKTVGSIERLAPGERIYSVRFMQGRAYLVTFQQTDPLFVIDLSTPTSPRVLGELKIPGFSQYLHPYDDTALIGFGRDTEARNDGGVIQKGLKLSLFDVSDVLAPREVDTYVFGSSSSYSRALDDHHAFLFSRDKNLLVIPFEDYEIIAKQELQIARGEPVISAPSRGASVFSVTKDGFSLKVNISHGSDYNSAIVRALYIRDNLYALSDSYATIHALVDIHELKRIGFQ